MATRSCICLPNDDGTFSARYHHWDGYPDGLGTYLHHMVDTLDKAKWLFGLNRSFSTIMNDIPNAKSEQYYWEKYNDKDSAVHWPAWTDKKEYAKSFLCCHPEGDTSGCKDGVSWKEIDDFCCEEYTYIFKDGSWHLMLVQDPNWNKCVTIDVAAQQVLQKMAHHLKDNPSANMKEMSAELNISQREIKSAIKIWSQSDNLVRDNFLDKYAREDFDIHPRILIEAFVTSLSLTKELEKPLKNARSSKIKL